MEIQTIKKYMKDNKITYDELARRTGLSKSCITKIFAGYARYPRIDTMQAIEAALELNRSPLEWTDEDKEAGVVAEYKEKLSPDERDWIDLYRALKSEKGEQTVRAIKTMMQNLLNAK
ncbi:MAG: helix-turn-helix transcriptional regulator [Clostridia bacterium]|nr:helix-turn-helix transcriptional regulator [Clostridia bacterium]